MMVSIIEACPGQWRWVFRDAANRVVASSALFSRPDACWQSFAQLSAASAFVH